MTDTDRMHPWDLASPDYNRWLISSRSRHARTADLLRMLLFRAVRAATYLAWRSERCNPVVDYTDDIDSIVVDEVINQVEERIDLARRGI